LDTESGYDVTIHYFPQDDKIASWYLKQEDSLSFWMKINITDPNNPYGVQDAFIRIGNSCGGYYQYTNDYFQNINPHILNNCIDQWVQFTIPLVGDSTWKRTSSGEITNFKDINYVEINVDVWEYGYEMWVDGLMLPFYPTGQKKSKIQDPLTSLTAYPNPFSQSTIISFTLPEPTLISLSIYDLLGTEVASLIKNEQLHGNQEIEFKSTGLAKGIYFMVLQALEQKLVRKLITAE